MYYSNINDYMAWQSIKFTAWLQTISTVERGVYNSMDECYVAGCLFKDMKFAKLICVCSPAQMMRKMFSYISYDYYPEIQTYCCDEMYHDYIEEFLEQYQ